MPQVKVYKTDGTQAGEITLKDEIFGAEVNESVLHQVVVAHLANKRQGTQSALTRAEVRGGGIKPWRQKGSGRARQGSIRSPQWTKGGIVFAPKPRSYDQKVNKKVKKIAFTSALSMKVRDDDFKVLEDTKLTLAKTKEVAKVLANLSVEGKVLFVTREKDEELVRASRNIPGVETAVCGALGVYDIINCKTLIISRDAVERIEEVYAQ